MLKKFLGLFVRLIFKIRFHNIEYLPKKGRAIITPNHLSNWDPFILYTNIDRKISFLAKQELFKNKLFGNFLLNHDAIPVNRDKPELSTIKSCLKVLENENILGIFPQGTRRAAIKEDDVKNGVSFIAFKSKAPVIPIKIVSDYKLFGKVDFYFGKPIYPELDENISQKENYDIFSKKIIRTIMELGNENSSS